MIIELYEVLKVFKKNNEINWNFVLEISKVIKSMNATNFCIHLNSSGDNQNAYNQGLSELSQNYNGDKNNVRNNIYYDTKKVVDYPLGMKNYYDDGPNEYEYNAFQKDRSTPIYIINKYPYLNYQVPSIQVYKDNLNIMKSAINYYFFTVELQRLNDILIVSIDPEDYNNIKKGNYRHKIREQQYTEYRHINYIPDEFNYFDDENNVDFEDNEKILEQIIESTGQTNDYEE